MPLAIRQFLQTSAGSASVEWILISALVTGFGMLMLTPIAFSSDSSAVRTGNAIGSLPVGNNPDGTGPDGNE